MQMYVRAGERKVAVALLKADGRQVLKPVLYILALHTQDRDLCFHTLDFIDQLMLHCDVCLFAFNACIHEHLDKLQRQDERTQELCNTIRRRLARMPIRKLIGEGCTTQ